MILPPQVRTLIQLALEEDLGRGDLSALALHPDTRAKATIVAKTDSVLAASFLLEAIAKEADADVKIRLLVEEGTKLAAGTSFVEINGSARDLLSLERTWLNFLQRSCGIASAAQSLRERLELTSYKVRITDTRKTLPGWRYLDKYCVKVGGLHNHRFGLDGGILVKENHIRAAGGIAVAIKRLQAEIPHGLKIQVEVTNQDEIHEAIAAGAEALLLDNFTPQQLTSITPELKKRHPTILLEASGGVTDKNVLEFSQTGVDLISMGALTHSVMAADLSLLFSVSA